MAERTPAWFKFAVVIGALAVGGAMIWQSADVSGAIKQSLAYLRDAGPLMFFCGMALLPLIGFPLAAFTVAAGPVFGPTLGIGTVIACAITAVVVNVALAYWLADRALRPLASRLVGWLGYRLPEITPRSAWPIILLIRILPGPPFFLQSYVLGLARAPFRVYMIVSSIVPAAYLSGTILLSDGLMRKDPVAVAGAVAIFFGAGAILHQFRIRLKPAASNPAAAPERDRDTPPSRR